MTNHRVLLIFFTRNEVESKVETGKEKISRRAKVRGFQALKRSKAIELTRQMDQREKGEGSMANSRVYAYKLGYVFVSFVSRSSKRIHHIDTRLFHTTWLTTIPAFHLFYPFPFSLFPHLPPWSTPLW